MQDSKREAAGHRRLDGFGFHALTREEFVERMSARLGIKPKQKARPKPKPQCRPQLGGGAKVAVRRSDGVVFESLSAAASEMGVLPTNLNRSIRQGKPVGGYTFEKMASRAPEKKANGYSNCGCRNAKRVRRSDGVEFRSQNAAAQAMGVSLANIQQAVRCGYRVKGYTFEVI